jgi:hypothetical protein
MATTNALLPILLFMLLFRSNPCAHHQTTLRTTPDDCNGIHGLQVFPKSSGVGSGSHPSKRDTSQYHFLSIASQSQNAVGTHSRSLGEQPKYMYPYLQDRPGLKAAQPEESPGRYLGHLVRAGGRVGLGRLSSRSREPSVGTGVIDVKSNERCTNRHMMIVIKNDFIVVVLTMMHLRED